MKKYLSLTILIFTLSLALPTPSFAQGMMGNWASSPSSVAFDDHTAREEVEGKEIWEKLQAKQLECKNLTDDNYAVLGEYFMGQSIGNTQRHAAMNQMMTSMMGEEGEEQMHIVMGKRLSGCDTSAQVPSNGVGFMPMMWMMGGGGNPMMGTGFGNMMGGWGGFSILFFNLSLIVWLIVGILSAVWLFKQISKK